MRIVLPVLFFLSPFVPLWFYFRYNWYSFFHLYSLSVFAGVSAYIYFLNQFISGVRVKFLDRLYGYDRMLLFHRYTGMLALALVIFHSRNKNVPHTLQVELGEVALRLFILVIVLAMLLLSQSFTRISVVRWVRQMAQKHLKMRYRHFRLIHNISAIAMLVALVHVLLAPSTQESAYRFATMVAWYVMAMCFYVRHKFILPRKYKKNPFCVVQVIREAPHIATLVLAKPHHGTFDYFPGQFCFMRFVSGNMRTDEHPYTISSAPHDPHIRITAKDCGAWSRVIPTQVAAGDYVAIDGAYGRFSYRGIVRTAPDSPLIFLAGGIGITPFMSMLGALSKEGATRTIRLIWKVRQENEMFLNDALSQWQTMLPALHTHLLVSATQQEAITVHDMCMVLQAAEISHGHFFVCGPSSMCKDVRRYLKKRHVSRARVHYENFSF